MTSLFTRQIEEKRLSLEDELLAQRREKLERIQALGFAAYPHKFDYTITVPEIV